MMRTLFLVLVVANIVAFVWFGWLRPPAPTPAFTPLPQVQPLELINELTPAQEHALASASATPSAPAGPMSGDVATEACVSYGPFPSAAAASTGGTRLRAAGVDVTQRLDPGQVRLGYWVYLPPFGSRREAQAAAKLLQQRGMRDLYVVTDAANRNAISLGVYSDRFGALAHQKKIRALGYHPLLTERFRDAPRYWLDAHGSAQQLPAASHFADLDEGDVTIGRSACSTHDKP